PDAAAASLVRTEIVDALIRWEPRIINIHVGLDDSEIREGKLIFNISYTVRDTNNPNNLVFPFYLYEGVGQQ
ncbi:MAG: GPW/gp25 family protein, partial [Oscillospiraceae bacterium]